MTYEELQERIAAVAAFNDVPVGDVRAAIKAAHAGHTFLLRTFGVSLRPGAWVEDEFMRQTVTAA